MLKKESAQMHFGLVTGITCWPWQTDNNGNLSLAIVKGIFIVEADRYQLPFVTNSLETTVLNTVGDLCTTCYKFLRV